jgi:integrase
MLIDAAKSLDRQAHLIVLMGGDAGLRCGEMMALEWQDVDLHKRQLCVQRSDWKGHVTVPKGGRLRYVPLTIRLATTLREHHHLRSDRVWCQSDGSPMSADIVKHHVERAAAGADCAERCTPFAAHVSVHIWRCAGRQHERFRSSPGTRISRRSSGTCTSVPRRSTARSDCSMALECFRVLETYWRRGSANPLSPIPSVI